MKLGATNPDITEEQLEDQMFEVLEAVEEHAPEVALGPVVAVNFTERFIELAFTVCHEAQSEAQRKIAEVVALIEQHTSLSFGGPDTSVREPDADHGGYALA